MPSSPNTIPLCAPHIAGREWEYVKDCLDSGWVSSVGEYVNRFERNLAARVGAAHAVATVNGTSALHVALQVAGVQAGDEVLTSTLSFIAPANAVRYLGAEPVFVDAEPEFWQMDVDLVERFLRTCRAENGALINPASGRRVRALVPVHILGHPVDIGPLRDLAARYDLRIVEDATESLGARYHDGALGAGGEIACFSFNGNKLITTGGGGMIVTDRADWAERARYLTTQAKGDPIEYVHGDVGYNYRLTNIAAAIGCAQLEQLDEFLAAKSRIAGRYLEAFDHLDGLQGMRQAPLASSAWWMFTVEIDPVRFGMDSRELMHALNLQGIDTRPLWLPLHKNAPYVRNQVLGEAVAEHLYRSCLSLPSSVGLSEQAQQHVIDCVRGNQSGAIGAHRSVSRG